MFLVNLACIKYYIVNSCFDLDAEYTISLVKSNHYIIIIKTCE